MKKNFTLIQITDTHLLDDHNEILRGHNPYQNLQMVLQQVKTYQPDGLLLTGDLADQGSALAYKYLSEEMNEFNCPIYWLHGNHDNPEHLKKILTPSQHLGFQVIDLGMWRLLIIDSVVEGAGFGEGYLDTDQLNRLRKELSQYSEKPTIIALHHHPIPTGIDWLDQIGVKNGDDLVMLLHSFPQVPLVLFGHIHHELNYSHINATGETINFFGCPSTFSQVTPLQVNPDDHLPGFRLIDLCEDGSYRTKIQRVK
ncbi:MAG: metallophosphoesterase [Cyanobacterium sp. T60_A2020_053]|nr:metallophosphoesterase [Cyanobacterium sp. T60_A2020_053]